jgi:hypothetical protein
LRDCVADMRGFVRRLGFHVIVKAIGLTIAVRTMEDE